MSPVSLRKSTEKDFEIFFQNQLDEEATYMAAFTPENPFDKEAYMTKWKRLLAGDTVYMQTILLDTGAIAGSVLSFEMRGELLVAYWLGKEYWNKGIATEALKQFLAIQTTRPIYGRAAADNHRSKRVLEKCGFTLHVQEKGFANARKMEIDEVVYVLE
ncbi:MAG TPA: GNAT family N-acetyltransferase [Bacteroidia bacterium]|nr:GNAT family N-acetyltransferase [Bacteroidia bacterium]